MGLSQGPDIPDPGLRQGRTVFDVAHVLLLGLVMLIFGLVVGAALLDDARAGISDGPDPTDQRAGIVDDPEPVAEFDPLGEMVRKQVARTGYAGQVGVVAVRVGDGWVMSQGQPQPLGKCDDESDCEDALDDMCEDAGHGGVKAETVALTQGGRMCSGDCEQHGAVAFIICADPKLF